MSIGCLVGGCTGSSGSAIDDDPLLTVHHGEPESTVVADAAGSFGVAPENAEEIVRLLRSETCPN